MAFVHGREGYFSIDDNAGTLQDISCYIGNVDLNREADTPEVTTFCDDFRAYITGFRAATISLSGFYDPASSAIDEILEGILTGANNALSKTFEYGPNGNAMGEVRYTGECFMTSYSVSSPVDGVVSFTADFNITGNVTRNTFP